MFIDTFCHCSLEGTNVGVDWHWHSAVWSFHFKSKSVRFVINLNKMHKSILEEAGTECIAASVNKKYPLLWNTFHNYLTIQKQIHTSWPIRLEVERIDRCRKNESR